MRPAWSEYFLELATVTATRATCPRRSVGCVIVKDNRVISQGYNGSPPGAPHCHEVGCELEYRSEFRNADPEYHVSHCVSAVHAEANAVAQAARNGVALLGSTAYVTLEPCAVCSKLMKSAGVVSVVFKEAYP